VLFGPALACFERIHGQSTAENERFAALGVAAHQFGEPGNLKFDACGPPASAESVNDLRRELGYDEHDRILVAGSTHAGEEKIVRDVFRRLQPEFSGLETDLGSAAPSQACEVRSLFQDAGFEARLLSEHGSGPERPAVVSALSNQPTDPGGARLLPRRSAQDQDQDQARQEPHPTRAANRASGGNPMAARQAPAVLRGPPGYLNHGL
jgi:hypothetical protein